MFEENLALDARLQKSKDEIRRLALSVQSLQEQINFERARNDANARAAADSGGGGCSIM